MNVRDIIQNWPGARYGMTPEQAQRFTVAQYISKTIDFTTVAGGTVQEAIELTGSATFLLGVRSDLKTNTTDSNLHRFTLQINNAWVFQNQAQSTLSLRDRGGDLPFVPYPRYITGSKGNIQLTITTVSGGPSELQTMTFYWLAAQ